MPQTGEVDSSASPVKAGGKRGGKSNTERSRKYRLAKLESGGAELSIFIGPTALAALHIIVGSREKSTQTQALERALIGLATQLIPDASSLHDQVLAGAITAATAKAWRIHCAQQDAAPSHSEDSTDSKTTDA